MRFDLAIIGAGVTGATIAHVAARHAGALRIAVFDARPAVQTATALSAGVVTPFCGSGARRARSLVAHAYYGAWARAGCCVRAAPFTFVADAPDAGGPLLAPPVADDPPDPGATPLVALPAGARLWRGGRAWLVDVPRLVAHYLTGARTVERFDAPVTHVTRDAGGWTVVAPGVTLRADRLIRASGPWPAIDGEAGVDAGTDIVTKKIVAFDVDGRGLPPPADAPVVYLPDAQAFLAPVHARRGWLLSITSHAWGCAAGARVAPSADERALAHALLDRHFPGLRDAHLAARTAVDGYTADRNPRVAPIGRDGCAVAGASGSGVRFAPALAYEALAAVGLPFEPDAATTAPEPPLCHRADKSAASLTESVQPCIPNSPGSPSHPPSP
ncbi:NAD(P)/FAD-dependent oxidoreductase [Burkholderia cenocepacia]|uniref:FAD-binding oxidoreductase n=2 Tax=Burkholderia cenocepacia TaxID=95486 RepID=A0ABD4UFQ5_9BURK|nr:FAD-dependent oxidoreductase [Burkholderia cenocepacia]MCW3695923.1 FAD-binding oxidoreductase [Burkholderia cenocepacia]MCW3704016.1 FAD-binding oxidoreductase [Burkholderia cenocepacia]MCW3712876.1 FAD-binding oxidoreductase [Burkholderia cenocepacia]MCW3720999.1 FAD-binding oxidoreductase [Burkholderia cenocepacia]MCW3728411.1 FAD-binding oxidoreductase [Burkholderia cenocepacia]